MANIPSKPIRKAAQVGNTPYGAAKPGANPMKPVRKSVAPFSNPGKGAYVRKPVGVSPATHDIHRSAGDAAQPHNNKGGQKMSNLKKGVD